jgi:3-oxoacyl-[acyl-carrier protein] reductase
MSDTTRPTALVTGGGRGIGAATARRLGARGYRVAVNYLSNRDAADRVLAAIRDAGGEAFAVQGDMRDPEQAAELIGRTAVDGSLDALVCSAGVGFAPGPIQALSWEDFRDTVTNELACVYPLTQQALKIMGSRGKGSIVIVSSAGADGPPGPGMISHGVAKSALSTFARFAAYEAGPLGVTVNVVAPGMVRTDASAHMPEEFKRRMAERTPLGRIAEPEDVANAIAMLVSEESGYISGQVLGVDGGHGVVRG